MAISGSNIVDRVRVLLNDVSAVRWPDAEMLLWLNDGRREMAARQPKIFGGGSAIAHTTTPGVRQQVAVTGAYRLVSIDSNADGQAIRAITRDQLDAFRPGWRNDTAADNAQNWCADDVDPLGFWIYPQVGAGKTLSAHAHITPPDLAALSATALPFDVHQPILTNYLCYRAYSKETEAGAIEKAAAYFKLFTEALS